MVQVVAEDIQPILVLTKTDLGYDHTLLENELKHLSVKVPFFSPASINPSVSTS